jgi:hypothetical protein
MTVSLAPLPYFRSWDNNGNPLVGGLLYTYVAGTSTPQATYTDSTQSTQNTNPVVLNFRGEASVWLNTALTYKLVLTDSVGNQIWSQDQIAGGYLPTAQSIGMLLYPQSVAEINASVVPVNYNYPWGNILRYGTNTTPGTSDMTAAFAALALTGYVGYAPAQDYLISNAVVWAVNYSGLVGDGPGTRILTNNATTDIFRCGTGSAQVTGLRFEGFRVWSTVQKTAGAVFNCQQIARSLFLNVHAGSLDDYNSSGSTNLLYDGYLWNEFSVIDVLGGECVGWYDVGHKINGSSTGAFGAEITLTDGHLIQGGSTVNAKAVYLSGASGGVYLDRCSISLCGGYGVYTDMLAAPTYYNRELLFGSACTIDTCANWGIYVASDSVALMEAAGLWVANCGNATTIAGGINTQPLVSGVTPELKLSDLQVYNNYYDGMQLNNCSATITGCIVRNNGTGSGGGHGILIPDPNTTPLNISGCFIHNNGNSTRGYAISITNGAQNNFLIEGNVLTANGQGGSNAQIFPPGSSTSAIIRNNLGHITENSGAATVLSGNTSVVVNHGLAGTPSFVLITPAQALDAGAYGYVAPGNFTSTQFTISYSTSAGANRSFLWRAVIGTQ